MRPNIGTELAGMRAEELRAPSRRRQLPRPRGRLRAAIGRRLIGSGERILRTAAGQEGMPVRRSAT
jgi:hypothetical protein